MHTRTRPFFFCTPSIQFFTRKYNWNQNGIKMHLWQCFSLPFNFLFLFHFSSLIFITHVLFMVEMNERSIKITVLCVFDEPFYVYLLTSHVKIFSRVFCYPKIYFRTKWYSFLWWLNDKFCIRIHPKIHSNYLIYVWCGQILHYDSIKMAKVGTKQKIVQCHGWVVRACNAV